MSKEGQSESMDNEKRKIHKASFISRLKEVVVDNKDVIGIISDIFNLGFKVIIAVAVVYLGVYFYIAGLPVYSGYGLESLALVFQVIGITLINKYFSFCRLQVYL